MDLHAIERPVLEYFRSKRITLFYSLFRITNSTRIVDLGGTLFFWELAEQSGFPTAKVTIVNRDKPRTAVPGYAEWLIGDARNVNCADNAFDIVFSNSLIEHLGSWGGQARLAAEIQRLAPRHFVQTPSRDFPVEPHFLTPFVHWMPKAIRASILRNFTVWGLITRPSKQQCAALAEEIRLLPKKDMARLFPHSDLKIEKCFGLPKSIIAVKA